MTIFIRRYLFVSIALIAALAAGCPEHKSIADINANPGKYQNKQVTVAGIVKDSYGISIPGTKYGGGAYKIDDGTGSIWIAVTDGNVPAKGSEIAVEGEVSGGMNWHGRNYGVGMYEKKRHYRGR